MTGRVFIPLLVFVGLLAGCLNFNADFIAPNGKYTSKDDFGVIIFKADKSLHYVFAAKFDFFDGANLPRKKATWFSNTAGNLEVVGIAEDEPKFHIVWYPKTDSFDLIRDEPAGTLPRIAHYERKG